MRIVRTLLPLVLGLVAFAATSARADRVDVVVPLATPASSQIATPGDVVTVGFLVTTGTLRRMTFTVKRGKGSKLVPVCTVIDPDGLVFDPAALENKGRVSKPGAATWSAGFPDVGKTGLWRLEVRGGSGSVGAFKATVKGKDTMKRANLKTSPPTVPQHGKVDVAFEAGENTALTVTAKRIVGSTLLMQLNVLDRNGNSVVPTVLSNPKNGALSLKGLRLPTFGQYTLRFTGGETGGGFSYAASTKPAKIKKGPLPTVVAAPAISEPLLVTSLDGSQSTPSAGLPLTYRWVQVSGDEVELLNPDSAVATFAAPKDPTSLAFQLSVAEGSTLLSRPATVSVEVAKRPIADAGRSQSVAATAAVTLDGTGSFDRRGAGLGFAWRQLPADATTVTLTGADTASPTFTAPNTAAVLHFGVTVDDGVTKSFENVVVVNVGDPSKSVANAGRDQYVPRMATVHLSGLASITPSGVLDGAVAWTQVGGPHLKDKAGNDIDPDSKNMLWPSFTAPKIADDYVFKLTIGGDETTADLVTVHVRADETNLPAPAKGNGPLNVGAGPQSLDANSPANRTVDPDADALRFRWAQITGAPLELTNAASATATATMVAGNAEYQFAVQANDGLQYGCPDIVVMRNQGFSARPIAIAGPDRSAERGKAGFATVALDGRASTRTDGGIAPISFQWTQISGKDWFDFAASSATFNPTVAQPSVALPPDLSSVTQTRTVCFQLVVNDGTTSSLPDIVSVTYTALLINSLPTVVASVSDPAPIAGAVVTLDAAPFDRDGDPVTLKWSQTAGPPVTLTPGTTAKSPSFVAPTSATPMKFSVIANDGVSDGPASNTVTVTVNQPPVANIVVTPLNGLPGTVVAMDGAAAINPSADPEGKGLTYLWRQISGTSVGLTGPQLTNSSITFTAPTGAVTFGLKVTEAVAPFQTSQERTATFSANLPVSVNPTASNLDTSINPQVAGVAGYAAYGATVQLNANGSGGTGTLSYTWRVVSQNPGTGTMPAPTFSNASAPAPTLFVQPPTSAGPFGYPIPAASNPGPQVVLGVTAVDGTSQSSGEQTITIRFFASFANGTASTAGSPGNQTVYGVVAATCTSCHSGTTNQCPVSTNAANYGMGSPAAFLANSRGVNACLSPSSVRLPAQGSTGGSGSSYLLGRLKNNPGPIMPQGGSLGAATINLIQDWIDQGSRTN